MNTRPDTEARANPSEPGPLDAFLRVALVEALSYLVLVAASVAHRGFGTANLVPYVGLVHGTIFLVYLALAVVLRGRNGWDSGTMIVIVLASVVPLGTLFVERRVSAAPDDPDLLHGWLMSRSGRNAG